MVSFGFSSSNVNNRINASKPTPTTVIFAVLHSEDRLAGKSSVKHMLVRSVFSRASVYKQATAAHILNGMERQGNTIRDCKILEVKLPDDGSNG